MKKNLKIWRNKKRFKVTDIENGERKSDKQIKGVPEKTTTTTQNKKPTTQSKGTEWLLRSIILGNSWYLKKKDLRLHIERVAYVPENTDPNDQYQDIL